MVAVGDKLGGRYFVTRVDAKVGPGSFVEVRDAQSNVFSAQLLSAKAMGPQELTALARELASVSPSPGLFLPDEVTQDPAGWAFAIFSRSPAELLSDDLRMYESGGSKQRRALTFRSLTGAFAALAEELARAAGARSMHGAIGPQHLGATGRDDTLKLELRGFGLDAAARILTKQERPPARVDAAALFLTLNDLLTQTQSLPEGAALVKWNLLVACARAGDHPALQNAGSLGRFLREALVEPDAPREPARAPAAEASAPVAAPPAAPLPPAPTGPRFDPRQWFDAHRRVVVFGAVGLGVVALAGAASSLLDSGPPPAAPPPVARPAARPAEPLPVCTGESLQAPASADLPPDGDYFDAACAGSSLRLFGASAANLSHAARGARRASPFADALTLTTGGRTETGNVVSAAGRAWVAWRNGERLLAASADEAGAAPLEGTFRAAMRGVWLLAAGEGQVWLASTAAPAQGPVAHALRLSATAAADTPRSFALGDGAIEAAIPGEAASLLIRRSAGRRHAFTCITVSTAVLPVLAVAPDAAAEGEPTGSVPEVSLQRTAEFVLEADGVTVAPMGAGRPGDARSFLLTEGAVGPVTLLTFPPQGTPVAERLSPRGTGVGLGANARGEPVAVVVEGDRAVLYTRLAGEAPSREPTPLRGLTRARLVSCGDEPWLAYTAGAPGPRVAAVPLACLSRHALAR